MTRTRGRVDRVRPLLVAAVLGIVAAGCATAPTRRAGAHNPPPVHSTSRTTVAGNTTTTATTEPKATAVPPTTAAPEPKLSPVTATAVPPTTTTTATPRVTALPPPAAGFVAGHVTAVGDSVMLDYETPLEADIPGVDVEATVSEQWAGGEEELTRLKAEGRLGAEVIVALGTNGPITTSDFSDMMSVLQGASRVVFVNVHVDRAWQDPNNAVLAQGAATYPGVLIADWATLAAANPQWFGPDGTHLAIDGPGAQALASLITSTLTSG